MNLIYSRRNRRKKKEYVKELEQTIQDLQAKVEQLTDKLNQYILKVHSMVIGEEDDFKDFVDYSQYAKTDFKVI